MAKTDPTKPGVASTVNNEAVLAVAAPPINAAAAATPDNTPLPGGGRWRWDIARPGWVDLDATAKATPDTTLMQPE